MDLELREVEEGEENFFDELINLLDMLKLKYQQNSKVVLSGRQVEAWSTG